MCLMCEAIVQWGKDFMRIDYVLAEVRAAFGDRINLLWRRMLEDFSVIKFDIIYYECIAMILYSQSTWKDDSISDFYINSIQKLKKCSVWACCY